KGDWFAVRSPGGRRLGIRGSRQLIALARSRIQDPDVTGRDHGVTVSIGCNCNFRLDTLNICQPCKSWYIKGFVVRSGRGKQVPCCRQQRRGDNERYYRKPHISDSNFGILLLAICEFAKFRYNMPRVLRRISDRRRELPPFISHRLSCKCRLSFDKES